MSNPYLSQDLWLDKMKDLHWDTYCDYCKEMGERADQGDFLTYLEDHGFNGDYDED